MKKIIFRMLCIGFLCVGFIMKAQGWIRIHDLSTGVVNGSTTLIAPGSADDTWKISSPGSTGPFTSFAPVCSHLADAWDIESCGRWITNKVRIASPHYPNENAAAGIWRYQTTFNISDLSIVTAYKVFFDYIGADNKVMVVKINGYSYPITLSGTNNYNPLTTDISFPINKSHLVIGTNEFIIEVYNSEAYTGLFVCGYIGLTYS